MAIPSALLGHWPGGHILPSSALLCLNGLETPRSLLPRPGRQRGARAGGMPRLLGTAYTPISIYPREHSTAVRSSRASERRVVWAGQEGDRMHIERVSK